MRAAFTVKRVRGVVVTLAVAGAASVGGMLAGHALGASDSTANAQPPAYLRDAVAADGTLDWDRLPQQIPVAGTDGKPGGTIDKGELQKLLDDGPGLNLDNVEPGVPYDVPVYGPTADGSFGVIGTQTCVVKVLGDSGRQQSCSEEKLDANAKRFGP